MVRRCGGHSTRNTESLVSETQEASKVRAVTEEAIVPVQLSPRLRAVTCMRFLWEKN